MLRYDRRKKSVKHEESHLSTIPIAKCNIRECFIINNTFCHIKLISTFSSYLGWGVKPKLVSLLILSQLRKKL